MFIDLRQPLGDVVEGLAVRYSAGAPARPAARAGAAAKGAEGVAARAEEAEGVEVGGG